ncbi:MAG: hypothetical protein ABIU54_06875, partial [Candidatus Eisenbacteria bacterium]
LGSWSANATKRAAGQHGRGSKPQKKPRPVMRLALHRRGASQAGRGDVGQRDARRLIPYPAASMTRPRQLPNGAAASIQAALPEGAVLPSALTLLAGHLDAFVDGMSLAERTDGLVSLAVWIRERDRSVPLPDGAMLGPGESNPGLRRLACLIRLLEISPPLRDAVRHAMGELLAATEAAAALADTGVDHDRGFFGELTRRMVARVLPAPREAHELGPLLSRMFPVDSDVTFIRKLPAAWFERLATALAPFENDRPWALLEEGAFDANALLAARVEAGALSPRLWGLSPTHEVRHSPFFALAERLREEERRPDGQALVKARLAVCRRELWAMAQQLEETGVTIGRVHALEVLGRSLDRLEALQSLRTAPDETRTGSAQQLLATVINAQIECRGIRRLASDNLRLLARRIVEGHGRTGEHYIARTRGEYVGMWKAALGGGLITVATAALKLEIALLGLAAMPEGILSSLNFSISFLLMLSMHLVLATKQPSMTAATLATIVRTASGPQRLDLLADQVAATVRTQLAAAMGNVLAVSAGALALDLGLKSLTGHSLLDAKKAEHVVHSFHPLLTGTIPYAALTGVILWASGLIGGWFENWSIANRIPEVIAQHPLGERLGRERLQRWGGSFGRNASAWGGSVALGFLLGLTPAFGKFMGLPIDVRHVTLSSGMLTFAASTLAGQPGLAGEVAWAVAGIVLIFALNLGVSFVLALVLALRAQDVPQAEAWRLARKLMGRFVRAPWAFIGPPARA